MPEDEPKKYGKNAAPGYVSISARVPIELRKAFKKRLIDEGTDTNTVVEALIRLWVSGEVEVAEPDRPEVELDRQATPRREPGRPRQSAGDARERFASFTPDEFRRLREALGYDSAQSFSKALDLDRTTWRPYETDSDKTPSAKVAQRLAEYLETRGIDAEALLAEPVEREARRSE